MPKKSLIDRIRITRNWAELDNLDIICLLMSKGTHTQLLKETAFYCILPDCGPKESEPRTLTSVGGIPIQITHHIEDLFLVTREKSFLNGYFDLYGCKFHPDDYLESSDAT